MKTLILFLALALTALPSLAQKRTSVRSYKTKSGKVVKPHQRTAPNRTQKDNWSTTNA